MVLLDQQHALWMVQSKFWVQVAGHNLCHWVCYIDNICNEICQLESVSLCLNSTSLNGLSVVTQLDNYPLSQDVPGKALDKNRDTDYLSNDIVDSTSDNSNLSIDTYPLVKDKDPPEVETASPAI